MCPTADTAGRFFERRTRVMTRALESPKTPLIASWGRNPGKAYASRRRFCLREVAMGKACQFYIQRQIAENRYRHSFPSRYTPIFTHTTS
jgi:hypothetical protein